MIGATKKWIFLKVSSIILIPLLIWLLINLISIYDKNFTEVAAFFTTQLLIIFDFSFTDCCLFLLCFKY